jgi:ligand-binding sensor domain-containing protein
MRIPRLHFSFVALACIAATCVISSVIPFAASAQTLVQSLERVYWSKSNQGLPDTNTIVRAIVASGGNVYAAVFGAGVFQSANAGAQWKAVNKGLANADIWALVVGKNGRLYAATTKGLFYTESSTRKGALLWRKTGLGAPVYTLALTERGALAGSLDSISFCSTSARINSRT